MASLGGWKTRDECSKGVGELHVQRHRNLRQHSMWLKRAGGKNVPEEKSRFENGGGQVPDNESPWASDG